MSRSASIVCLLTCAFPLVMRGQSAENAAKHSHPQKWDSYFTQIQEFKKTARSSYADEQAREKVGDCPHVASTHDIVTCLESELEKSMANYRAYTVAIRAMEALASPADNSSSAFRGVGPLTPEELTKEFDEVEAAWQIFRKAQCSIAYDAYRDGTIAPIMQLTCELRLLRDRMSELESIYQLSENR